MAYYSIAKRPRADGTIRYRCTVGIKENGKHLYRETKTFGKQIQAKAWGNRRVAELESEGAPQKGDSEQTTLRTLLTKYIDDPNMGGKAGRNKLALLNRFFQHEIVDTILAQLSQNHVIEYCRYRASIGAGPATLEQEMIYLSGVLDSAKPVYGITYTDNPVRDSRRILSGMGLTGKPQRRSRRVAEEEIELLLKALEQRQSRSPKNTPYADMFNFSILTCMRLGEVCRIRWEDIDEAQRAVMVRDRKDPRKKEGNHMMVPLLGEAWDIAQRQPKTSDRIFPYSSSSISSGFMRVKNELGIKDLHYHDLRREGASRLFEAGFSIEEVAQVTGHRSLNVLWQVYTELYPKSLHEKFDQVQKSRLNENN